MFLWAYEYKAQVHCRILHRAGGTTLARGRTAARTHWRPPPKREYALEDLRDARGTVAAGGFQLLRLRGFLQVLLSLAIAVVVIQLIQRRMRRIA
jgi:hypothetical protein